jgi:hypothetical protein
MVRCFRREYKYTLGEGILRIGWEVLDAIIEANAKPNNAKVSAIRHASTRFDQLKTRLRMAHELKLVSHRQLAFLTERNAEIGRMLNGWAKWAERQ